MKDITFYKKELISICQSHDMIYIYGAGKNASLLYYFLKTQEIPIKDFIVTEMSGNPETLFGHAVITADKLPQGTDHVVLVPVSEVGKDFKEICTHLVNNRVNNVYFFTRGQLEYIRNEVLSYKVRDLFQDGIYRFEENVPVEKGYTIFSIEKEGRRYHWRFRNSTVEEQDIHSAFDMFPKMSAFEEFEKQYGEYRVFHSTETGDDEREGRCNVYMACSHVDKAGLHETVPSWVIPIQVGAELTDRKICKLRDNIGENISERNQNYSECTALFWMWKNAPKTDYIGLCHYRRHFDLGEDAGRELAASGLDVLVTAPAFIHETIGSFFETLTPKADLKAMLKAIENVRPEYLAEAEAFFASRFYPPCNLFIMKYELFQEYAQFVFSVTFEIEAYYNGLGFHRRDRYMGYIIECLLGIFLMKNKERLKIGYTDMLFYW